MNSSQELGKLAEALAFAQAEFEPILKDKHNPAFKSAANPKGTPYASLASQIKATKNALAKHGLAISQSAGALEGRVIIVTKLVHKSGQWIDTQISIKPAKDDAQGVGSAITYGRRYGRSAILDIDAEESDDDGNEAATTPEPVYKATPEQVAWVKEWCGKLGFSDPEAVSKKLMDQPMAKIQEWFKGQKKAELIT